MPAFNSIKSSSSDLSAPFDSSTSIKKLSLQTHPIESERLFPAGRYEELFKEIKHQQWVSNQMPEGDYTTDEENEMDAAGIEWRRPVLIETRVLNMADETLLFEQDAESAGNDLDRALREFPEVSVVYTTIMHEKGPAILIHRNRRGKVVSRRFFCDVANSHDDAPKYIRTVYPWKDNGPDLHYIGTLYPRTDGHDKSYQYEKYPEAEHLVYRHISKYIAECVERGTSDQGMIVPLNACKSRYAMTFFNVRMQIWKELWCHTQDGLMGVEY